MTPLDLDWARAGYLRTPGGTLRHIIGLDRLAADTLKLGARVWWGDLRYSQAGYCYPVSRSIVLAEWLILCPPWFIRRVWSNELGHVAVGASEERAQRWQTSAYGELVVPAVWLA